MPIINIFAILFLLSIFSVFGLLFYEMMTPIQYTPMTYEEEINWLTETCRLTEKEAKEIADI
jgi:hypothetical protein